MMNEKEIEMYDYLVDTELFTTAELSLVRNLVSGSWEEILNAAIYARYGYRNIDQLREEVEGE